VALLSRPLRLLHKIVSCRASTIKSSDL
jgi:hypothetical protein